MGIRVHQGYVAGGFAAVIAGAAAMIGLHLSTGLDPLHSVISEYAFEPEGWLLAASLTLFAAGSVLFAVAMIKAGADRRIAWLIVVWGLCMLLIGAFPTDKPGVPLSMSGGIHRYAAFVAFLSMPVAGLALARRLGRDRSAAVMRVLSGIALACLVAVVVPYVLRMGGLDVANEDIPAGLTQRLVVVTEVGVLVLLGGLLRRQAIGRAVRQTAR
ncbi:DUF998 domain-containing protein [Streptosporangium sp. KLBMP 9127]|nr:DUF998 domain-containing protein [Streptosporangium sp. KLBMP 9127]